MGSFNIMPLYHCKKCQHEWEASESKSCDWCGCKENYILEEKTPLEKMVENIDELLKKLKEIK